MDMHTTYAVVSTTCSCIQKEKKAAYDLARSLILRTSTALEQPIWKVSSSLNVYYLALMRTFMFVILVPVPLTGQSIAFSQYMNLMRFLIVSLID